MAQSNEYRSFLYNFFIQGTLEARGARSSLTLEFF